LRRSHITMAGIDNKNGTSWFEVPSVSVLPKPSELDAGAAHDGVEVDFIIVVEN
jgi:hypothetical protein